VQTYSNGDSSCATYEHCAGGADVTLCTVQGGGHTWPGGLPVPTLGMTTTDLSATDAMWTFFQAHPMP
jgi:polyhydroxybutyrate depolymerase